jgi:hypothetical protein
LNLDVGVQLRASIRGDVTLRVSFVVSIAVLFACMLENVDRSEC